jgi:hypothetical protein
MEWWSDGVVGEMDKWVGGLMAKDRREVVGFANVPMIQ